MKKQQTNKQVVREVFYALKKQGVLEEFDRQTKAMKNCLKQQQR